MQSQTTRNRKPGFAGAKVIIGMMSLAGTFGLWNIFAGKAEAKVSQPPEPTEPQQSNIAPVSLEFPPMPTLASIRVIEPGQTNGQNVSLKPDPVLRQVSQPTPAPKNASKPVFEQIIINQPGGGGSFNSGPASSGSSR